MLSLEEAVERTLESVPFLGCENVKLEAALGRFAGIDLKAKESLPGFDNSAMDGYAVKSADLKQASANNPVTLACIGVVPAGQSVANELRSGTCMRIFTGSPVPSGADAVIMQEDCKPDDKTNTVQCLDHVRPWENIRMQGEDVKSGEIVAGRGTKINPGAIGLLAATGHHEVNVGQHPKIALVATGSELVEAPNKLAPGKIYDSNRSMLASMVSLINGLPKTYPIVNDTLDETVTALEKAFNENDVILTSGGVSVGDHDHVKPALEKLGGKIDLWKVAIKPGKPFVLGQAFDKPLFGLPGNPASALVTYLLLVRPALLKMQGASNCLLARRHGHLAMEMINRGDRRHFVRVAIDEEGEVTSAGGQRSHMLGSLAKANGIIDVAANTRLASGEKIEVLMIDG